MIPIKISASYFVYIDKLIVKSVWKDKRPKIFNTILKYKIGELTAHDFKIYYTATVIKTQCYWQRVDMDQ